MTQGPFDDQLADRHLGGNTLGRFLEAVHTQKPVGGLTHNFYRYPARFSPLFARAAIEAFSAPGDVILDPFMGGATSLVESRALGRHSVGSDISSLATFVARVKTRTLWESDLQEVVEWVASLDGQLNLHQPAENAAAPSDPHYQRHVPWPIRKTMGLVLARVPELILKSQQGFARCLLLKLSQWALDCRSRIPISAQFRDRLAEYLDDFVEGMREFRRSVHEHRPPGIAEPVAHVSAQVGGQLAGSAGVG